MTSFVRDVRNPIVQGLSDYLAVPVVLSEQTTPWPKNIQTGDYLPAFGYYATINPYIPGWGSGNIERRTTPDGGIELVRTVEPTATLSFTFCAENRQGDDGPIFGEDEAMSLALKAIGWFEYVGRTQLSAQGIAVLTIENAASRTFLAIDDMVYRWGFDVEVRYTHIDVRRTGAIDENIIIQQGGN